MGICRERAWAQLIRRGVAAGLFGVIVCFAASTASAQESTKASTKASTQAATKASTQAAAKASTQAATKASTQAAAKASTKASTQAATKVPAQAAAKASPQAAAKASPQAAAKASAKESAKESSQDASAQLPLKLSGSQLEPVQWSELAGWTADDHLAAFAAYQAGCRAARKTQRTDHAEISGALWNVCRNAIELKPQDSDTARAFFERNFQPVRIARLGEGEGLLTGYFEPVVAGSRFPSPEFHVPVYRRPRDLVAAGYNPASIAFPNKGARIGRRDGNNELVPYYDRGAIEAGALDGQKLEICWLKDPFDLLTIQIEGSARVILEDGTPLRISYDSHNGYRYSSIERVLVERNLISRQEMSAQRIRDWMAAHPEEAATVRAANRSYVFFRITGLSNEGEPVGAQGVPLTPGRSIAVDRVHEYGTPFFIEANLPIESGKSVSRFGRLMIAQDTGSALVGPARADLYWGAGDDAGRIASRIRHPGRFAMLVPRELDLVAAGRQMPLPVPKPKIPEVEVDKTDGKGTAPSPNAGAIATGKELPKHPASPAPKPKMAASDVKKEIKNEDGKGRATSVNTGATVAGKNLPKHPASPAPKPKIAASDVKKESKKEDGKGSATSANTGATVAGKQPPKHPTSPAPKPKMAAGDVKKEVKKEDGKGRATSADSGATAAGKQPPKHPALPPSKPKVPVIEVKKKDGKDKANSANTANSGEDWRATASSGRPSAPARMAN
jgi:membrane-bound lytic murein transglycosylase A